MLKCANPVMFQTGKGKGNLHYNERVSAAKYLYIWLINKIFILTQLNLYGYSIMVWNVFRKFPAITGSCDLVTAVLCNGKEIKFVACLQ